MEITLIEFNLNLAMIIGSMVGIVWLLKQYTKVVLWFIRKTTEDREENMESIIKAADTAEK